LISLIRIPHVDVDLSFYIDNAPKKCEKSQQQFKILNPNPMYQTSKKPKVREMKLEMNTSGSQLCAYMCFPTFNNLPSTFAKFARWWEFAHIRQLQRAPCNPQLETHKATQNAQTHWKLFLHLTLHITSIYQETSM
jgi:hypothetical protein